MGLVSHQVLVKALENREAGMATLVCHKDELYAAIVNTAFDLGYRRLCMRAYLNINKLPITSFFNAHTDMDIDKLIADITGETFEPVVAPIEALNLDRKDKHDLVIFEIIKELNGIPDDKTLHRLLREKTGCSSSFANNAIKEIKSSTASMLQVLSDIQIRSKRSS